MKLFATLALLLALAAPASAMQKRSSNVTDATGRVIANATVTVYNYGTSTPATIYSDNGINTQSSTIVVNPTDGSYSYYAANGRYTETITAAGYTFSGAQTIDLLLFDPLGPTGTSAVVGSGQSNFINMLTNVAPSGTTQQIGYAATITGAATALIPGSSFRIAGYFGAETRAGGESILGHNITVTARNGDPAPTMVQGLQLLVNNNQPNSALNCSAACYDGFSLVSGGTGIASYALNIGGTGQWQQGVEVDQGAIATGGFAFNYKGNGTQGAFQITDKSAFTPGSFVFANIGSVLTANGMMGYCADCTIANPCGSGGNGAFAKRLNGVNVCN